MRGRRMRGAVLDGGAGLAVVPYAHLVTDSPAWVLGVLPSKESLGLTKSSLVESRGVLWTWVWGHGAWNG